MINGGSLVNKGVCWEWNGRGSRDVWAGGACKAKTLRTGVRMGYMHLIMISQNEEKYTRGFQGEEEWDKCSKDFLKHWLSCNSVWGRKGKQLSTRLPLQEGFVHPNSLHVVGIVLESGNYWVHVATGIRSENPGWRVKEEGRGALKMGHCCDLAVKMDLPPKCLPVLEV